MNSVSLRKWIYRQMKSSFLKEINAMVMYKIVSTDMGSNCYIQKFIYVTKYVGCHE